MIHLCIHIDWNDVGQLYNYTEMMLDISTIILKWCWTFVQLYWNDVGHLYDYTELVLDSCSIILKWCWTVVQLYWNDVGHLYNYTEMVLDRMYNYTEKMLDSCTIIISIRPIKWTVSFSCNIEMFLFLWHIYNTLCFNYHIFTFQIIIPLVMWMFCLPTISIDRI